MAIVKIYQKAMHMKHLSFEIDIINIAIRSYEKIRYHEAESFFFFFLHMMSVMRYHNND